MDVVHGWLLLYTTGYCHVSKCLCSKVLWPDINISCYVGLGDPYMAAIHQFGMCPESSSSNTIQCKNCWHFNCYTVTFVSNCHFKESILIVGCMHIMILVVDGYQPLNGCYLLVHFTSSVPLTAVLCTFHFASNSTDSFDDLLLIVVTVYNSNCVPRTFLFIIVTVHQGPFCL